MLLSVSLAATLAAAAQQPPPTPPTPPPSVTITRAVTPPRLEDFRTGERRDGVIADTFLQREPGALGPATEKTQTSVSYDAANLYVIFVCHATDPSRIRARMNRREQIFNDD